MFEPFLRELYVRGGRAHDDFVTAALGTHLAKDATRQVAWTDAFLAQCMADEANATVIAEWVDKWLPDAVAALDELVSAHPAGGVSAAAAQTARADAKARLEKLEVKLSDSVATALEGGSQ